MKRLLQQGTKIVLQTFACMLLLSACRKENPAIAAAKHDSLQRDTIVQPDDRVVKTVFVYQYDSTWKDSSLVCFIAYDRLDIVVNKKGEYYYGVPPEADYFDYDNILDGNTGPGEYMESNPLVCEAGGASPYNKFVVSCDSSGRATEVKHFTEGFESEDDPHPQWYYSDKVTLSYSGNARTENVTGADGSLHYWFVRVYDAKKRLVSVKFNAWNEQRYGLFFHYPSKSPAYIGKIPIRIMNFYPRHV